MIPVEQIRQAWISPSRTSPAQQLVPSYGTKSRLVDTPLITKHLVFSLLFLTVRPPCLIICLAAADDVENEALAPNFNGVLGLALPLNSIIAFDIPPVTNNNPDGAAWASNLFSLTPTSTAPSSRFLSLALSRPGSDTIPAVLGIGQHPYSLVPDPSLILYSTLVSDKPGILYWKVSVTAITVYVNGTTERVQLGKSVDGASSPIAVLDSGVSVILTTSDIANGIYGAIGISPASNGMCTSFFLSCKKYRLFILLTDYVPCTTPLNMTISLDDRPEIPLHPLDLTAEPPQNNQAEFCVGLIQTADSQFSNPSNSLGDIILGVPFLRNVYTVMAYTTPNANGSFSPVSGNNQTITPRLGLLSLTDPTIALEQFYTVRELNQPISGGGNSTGGSASSSSSNSSTVNLGGKKLPVGIVVLIGILSFFGLCCVLFVARWFMIRRTYRKTSMREGDEGDVLGGEKSSTTTEVFMLTKTISSKDEEGSMGLFKADLEEVAMAVGDEKILSDSSDDETNVAVVEDGGMRTGGGRESMGSGDNTFVQHQQKVNPAQEPDHLHSSLPPSSPTQTQQQPPPTSSDPHTLARQSPSSPTPNNHETESQKEGPDLGEFGVEDDDVRTSMAGIGTASRSSKAYLDSSFLRSLNMNSGVIMTTATSADESGV